MVLTKTKGSKEPYRIENLEDFLDGADLPKFDLSIKWRTQEDRPPRRRLSTPDRPATRQKEDGTPATSQKEGGTPAQQNHSQLVRQLSKETEEETTSRKKQKKGDERLETPAFQKIDDMDVTQ